MINCKLLGFSYLVGTRYNESVFAVRMKPLKHKGCFMSAALTYNKYTLNSECVYGFRIFLRVNCVYFLYGIN